MTTMTSTRLSSTLLGSGLPVKSKIIGVISYRTITGQLKQTEVKHKFWTNTHLPDKLDSVAYLIGKGVGLVRFNTVRYSPLV